MFARLAVNTRNRTNDRGAVVAEFALVLPFLVIIMLGTITAGIALNDDLQLNHSTRDAARYGATIPSDQTFASGGDWATNVREVVLSRFGNGLASGDVCVALVTGVSPFAVSTAHTTAGGTAACFDDSAAGISDTRVQVTASVPAEIETGLYTVSLSLTAEAVTMHESNA